MTLFALKGGPAMPWKECHIVDERLRFVARLLDGEQMARVGAAFGISRKTGYKTTRATRTRVYTV